MLRATTACTFSTSQLPKVVRTWCVLYILTWKFASRHNGVHFFDISASKSGPDLVCLYILTWKFASRHNGVHFFDSITSKSVFFLLFYLQTCFAPQRRAIFHLSSGQLAPPLRLLFDPPEGPNHWKNAVNRDFLTFFAHLHLLASHSFSSLIFSLLDFSSLTLPTSAFPSLHIVGRSPSPAKKYTHTL